MAKDPIQSVIDQLESSLVAAHQLQKLIAEHPPLMEALRRELSDSREPENGHRPVALPAQARVSAPAPSGKRTHFEAARDWFIANANQWASTSEIASGIGLTRESISRLVYKSHKEQFEHRPRPGAGATKIKDWRLKPQRRSDEQKQAARLFDARPDTPSGKEHG